MATRPVSKVVIKRIDFTNEMKRLFDSVSEDAKQGAVGFVVRESIGYNVRSDNTVYFLDGEGVGGANPLPKNKTITIPYGHNCPGKILLGAAGYITYTVEELLTLPCEDVLLSDFIRSFGSRLESNFAMWEKVLA